MNEEQARIYRANSQLIDERVRENGYCLFEVADWDNNAKLEDYVKIKTFRCFAVYESPYNPNIIAAIDCEEQTP